MTNDDDGGWIGGGEPKLFNATPDVLIKIKGLVAAGGRTLGESLRRAVGVHSERAIDGSEAWRHVKVTLRATNVTFEV